jgi:hypothetical protein
MSLTLRGSRGSGQLTDLRIAYRAGAAMVVSPALQRGAKFDALEIKSRRNVVGRLICD